MCELKKARKSGKEKVQRHAYQKERVVRPKSSRMQSKKKVTRKRQDASKESGNEEDKTILDRMQMVIASRESTTTRPRTTKCAEVDVTIGNNEGVSNSIWETISLLTRVKVKERVKRTHLL